MTWPAAFLVFLVSHLVGDFLLQTEWQAVDKASGLGDPRGRRALLSHVAVYTLAFLPALVWIGIRTSGGRAVAAGAMVALTHLLIDDGRLVTAWLLHVKHASSRAPGLSIAVDQSFHVVCLLAAALIAAA